VRTNEEIQRDYAEKCAKLGELVFHQRKLHTAAEHIIREIEQIEQDARQLNAPKESAPTDIAPVAQE